MANAGKFGRPMWESTKILLVLVAAKYAYVVRKGKQIDSEVYQEICECVELKDFEDLFTAEKVRVLIDAHRPLLFEKCKFVNSSVS